MGCCVHCRGNYSDKTDIRRTIPSVELAELTSTGEQHAILSAYTYIKCPNCKKEWSSIFKYEVFTQGNATGKETALEKAKIGMKECGYTREWGEKKA